METDRQITNVAMMLLIAAFFVANGIPILGPCIFSFGLGYASRRIGQYGLSNARLIISIALGITFFFAFIAMLMLGSIGPILRQGFAKSIAIGYATNLILSLTCYLIGKLVHKRIAKQTANNCC